MRIAVCDDEKIFRDEILRYCKEILPPNTEYRCFATGEELLSSDFEYDFLLLDIEMPGMDGIEIKDLLEKAKSQARIIFTTSHEERMVEAFGEKVIGFIRKPFQRETLDPIAKKIKTYYDQEKIEWIEAGKHYAIFTNSICYIEAQDKYTCLVLNSEKHLVRRTLNEWEKLLPKNSFCRINRSYLVNLKLFDKISNHITLEEGKIIRLSRKNKSTIEEKYKAYIREKAGDL